MSAVTTRAATAHDAQEAMVVIVRSITELCGQDHRSDPATLERWLANKTPTHFLTWLANEANCVFVAEQGSVIAGVAALHRAGEIRLCYARPDLVRMRVGRALIDALEDQARALGLSRLVLNSSATARAFYERCGYVPAGEAKPQFGVLIGYPYAKTLQAQPLT